jgi:molybdenum cofactor biosynthesis protein B
VWFWKKQEVDVSTEAHRAGAPQRLSLAVICVSSTRSLAEDESGHWMVRQAEAEGHQVVRHVTVADDTERIAGCVRGIIAADAPQVLLLTGGTGVAARDVTIEALRPLFTKELPAFGALFAQLSFSQIGSAAVLSRATAAVVGSALLFCLPGSLRACQLACQKLIFPELGHLARHLGEP